MQSRLSARKRQGEAAEARFLLDASTRGLLVFKPWGDSAPFDFIVDGSRGLYRVQVNSVWAPRARRERSYWVAVRRGKGRRRTAYRPSDVDFVVVLLHREMIWYIIPVRALAGRKTIGLGSDYRHSRRLFEKYREAWSLLG